MSRLQLALNVTDLQGAVEFYTKLFDTPPAKLRPGYANFAVVDPPLKLVLIEGQGAGGGLNHLGVEVATTEAVAQAQQRLSGQGLDTASEDNVACCHALQDKVWVDGPDGEPWEIYTVLADADIPGGQLRAVNLESSTVGCCHTSPAASVASCCDQTVTGDAARPPAC